MTHDAGNVNDVFLQAVACYPVVFVCWWGAEHAEEELGRLHRVRLRLSSCRMPVKLSPRREV